MNWKRTLSGLLVAAMMVSVVPASAVGDTSNDVEPMTQERVDAANEAYNDAETKLKSSACRTHMWQAMNRKNLPSKALERGRRKSDLTQMWL